MYEAALFSVLVGDVALPASQNRYPKPSIFAGRVAYLAWELFELCLYLWGFQDNCLNLKHL